VEQARQAARHLLELHRQGKWPRDFPDDNIWHAATEAEAHLLLGEVGEAERLYRRALAEGAKAFYQQSIGGQLRRLMPALEGLSGVDAGATGAAGGSCSAETRRQRKTGQAGLAARGDTGENQGGAGVGKASGSTPSRLRWPAVRAAR